MIGRKSTLDKNGINISNNPFPIYRIPSEGNTSPMNTLTKANKAIVTSIAARHR
jgi:hypothetical protein